MSTDRRSARRCAQLVLLTVGIATFGWGQQRLLSSDPDREQDMMRTQTAQTPTNPSPRVLAMESTIDPTHFFVGPSDLFTVAIWSVPPQTYSLAVTPEGTLIVPTVGEVPVADITLAEAKERVLAAIRRRYARVEATATLVIPRTVLVTVQGNVLTPGSYALPAYNRVDKAVEEANKLPRPQLADVRDNVLRTMSLRSIRVVHKDGKSSRVDIPKFRATRDDALNPYLREGDVVVVPMFDDVRGTIGIHGEVNTPERFEFVEGDSLADALNLVFGLTPRAKADSIELLRFAPGEDRLESRIFDAGALADGRVANIALRPGDRVVVRRKREQRGDYKVRVVGEVRFPGVYALTLGSTRLSEIINKAGGFTPEAFLTGAEIIRASFEQKNLDLERIESLRGGVPDDDSSYYQTETALRLRKEVVNADFRLLFEKGDSTQDVILRNDDVILVPGRLTTVYVFGQVVSPGYVSFEADRGVAYYLAQAGGVTDRARDGDIKIVKARTRQWLSPDETTIEPGDYVWVPKDLERPFSYYMNLIGQTASIVSVAVSIVLLAIQFNK